MYFFSLSIPYYLLPITHFYLFVFFFLFSFLPIYISILCPMLISHNYIPIFIRSIIISLTTILIAINFIFTLQFIQIFFICIYLLVELSFFILNLHYLFIYIFPLFLIIFYSFHINHIFKNFKIDYHFTLNFFI